MLFYGNKIEIYIMKSINTNNLKTDYTLFYINTEFLCASHNPLVESCEGASLATRELSIIPTG